MGKTSNVIAMGLKMEGISRATEKMIAECELIDIHTALLNASPLQLIEIKDAMKLRDDELLGKAMMLFFYTYFQGAVIKEAEEAEEADKQGCLQLGCNNA